MANATVRARVVAVLDCVCGQRTEATLGEVEGFQVTNPSPHGWAVFCGSCGRQWGLHGREVGRAGLRRVA